jgi:3-phosphoinositide dependent protein kinase-1
LAQFYAVEIVNILEHMHSRGIAHRDIKPENILLDANYHLKLVDFGTAKLPDDPLLANETDPLGPTTKGHTFVGTAEYVSPEVLLDKESGPASDLWALGCMVYEFLTGRAPFKGKTDFLTFALITKGEVAYPLVYQTYIME